MPKQNRTRRVELRFTEDEFHILETAAQLLGQTLSEYIRGHCVGDDASIITILNDRRLEMKRMEEAKKKRPKLDDFTPTYEHTKKSPFDGLELLPEDNESLSERVIIEPMLRKGAAKPNRISFRVSDYEWKVLHYKARLCKTTLTKYILAKAVYEDNGFGSTDISVSKQELKQVRNELRRQGANLNQISRGVNILSQLQQRDDVDAEVIDHLTRNLVEDNQQTRALINDALIKVTKALSLIEPKRK